MNDSYANATGEMMPEAEESTSVTITRASDGTFTVTEGEDSGSAPGGMTELTPGGEQPSEAQTAASLDEALDMVRQMLDPGDEGGMSVEEAFGKGFNGEME